VTKGGLRAAFSIFGDGTSPGRNLVGKQVDVGYFCGDLFPWVSSILKAKWDFVAPALPGQNQFCNKWNRPCIATLNGKGFESISAVCVEQSGIYLLSGTSLDLDGSETHPYNTAVAGLKLGLAPATLDFSEELAPRVLRIRFVTVELGSGPN
jgi:hypothetical protein